MRFRLKNQVLYSSLGFWSRNQVWDCRVWDSGLRFTFDIQVWNKIWDSGLGLRFWIQVCHLCFDSALRVRFGIRVEIRDKDLGL